MDSLYEHYYLCVYMCSTDSFHLPRFAAVRYDSPFFLPVVTMNNEAIVEQTVPGILFMPC